MTLPDNKIDQLKSLIKKHMGSKWMEEHAKRTGINSIDTFFAKLPTEHYDCCSRSCRKSRKLMKSDHQMILQILRRL